MRLLHLELYCKCMEKFHHNVLSPETIRKGELLEKEVLGKYSVRATNPEHIKLIQDRNAKSEELPAYVRLHEAAIMDCVANGWLGEGVLVRKSEYDDLVHGVDMSMAIVDKNGHVLVTIALDLTTNRDALRKKMGRIKHGHSSQELSTVTYPGMASAGYVQEQTGVPHCLLVSSKDRAQKFIEAWVTTRDRKEKGGTDLVSKHPMRWMFIYQMHEQFKAFHADSVHNQLNIAEPKYRRVLEALKPQFDAMPADIRNEIAQSPKTFDFMLDELLQVLSGFDTLESVDPKLGKSDIRAAQNESRGSITAGTVMAGGRGNVRPVTVEVKKKRVIPPRSQ